MKIFTRKIHERSGSLQLSINAIVILVMAMVVLGLGLGFIRNLFDKGTENLGAVMDVSAIENPPSAEKPVTVGKKTVDIKMGGTATLRVGFYNNANGELTVKPGNDISMIACEGIGGEKSFPVVGPSTKVFPGESVAFETIISADIDKLDQGTYSCRVDIMDYDDDAGVLASAPFYLRVI